MSRNSGMVISCYYGNANNPKIAASLRSSQRRFSFFVIAPFSSFIVDRDLAEIRLRQNLKKLQQK